MHKIKLIGKLEVEFNNEDEMDNLTHNWIDQASNDFTLFKLNTLTYSYQWQWSRFIRSNNGK